MWPLYASPCFDGNCAAMTKTPAQPVATSALQKPAMKHAREHSALPPPRSEQNAPFFQQAPSHQVMLHGGEVVVVVVKEEEGGRWSGVIGR